MACEEVLVKELHARGLRLTPQRQLVLEAMHADARPATAEEVYDRVLGDRSLNVDITTVYRTLDLLEEMELVGFVDLGDGVRRYALLTQDGPHSYLRCEGCGKLIALESGLLDALRQRLFVEAGFVTRTTGQVIRGVCRECEGRTDTSLMSSAEGE